MPRTDPRPRGASSPLSSARMAAGLTQAQLAQEVGCTQKDISRWENGIRNPKMATLQKMAHALKCPLEELIQ